MADHDDAGANGAVPPPPPLTSAAPPPPPPVGAAPMAFDPAMYPAPAPARRRRVWPWVVGGVGALALLGGGAVALAVFAFNVAGDAVNPDYHGEPIAADDEASSDHFLVVTDSGNVAYELPNDFEDESETFRTFMPDIPSTPGATVEGFYAYVDGGLMNPDATSIVMMFEMSGQTLLPGDLPGLHEDFLSGFRSTSGSTMDDGIEETTGEGLASLHSTGEIAGNPQPTGLDVYTLGRGDTVLWVAIMEMPGSDQHPQDIVDSVRIDD